MDRSELVMNRGEMTAHDRRLLREQRGQLLVVFRCQLASVLSTVNRRPNLGRVVGRSNVGMETQNRHSALGPAQILVVEVLASLDVEHALHAPDGAPNLLEVGQVSNFDHELTRHPRFGRSHVGVRDVGA